MTALATQQPKPAPTFLERLEANTPQIAAVLPAHITADKFKRIVVSAVTQNPDLLKADQRSLFNACVKCASDGLVPDGREAALVVFNTKQRFKDEAGRWQERWLQMAQYMPMVRGIIKLARQSGDIKQIGAHCVYEEEVKQGRFKLTYGDGEQMHHEPILYGDRGPMVLVYAAVTFTDGSVQREFLNMQDIAKIRAVSRSKDKDGNPYGPWKDWFEEMAKKSAIRRVAKYLHLSADVQRAIDRDEEESEFEKDRKATLRLAASQLGAAQIEDHAEPAHDPETGEIVEDVTADADASQDAPEDRAEDEFDYEGYLTGEAAQAAAWKTSAELQEHDDGVKATLKGLHAKPERFARWAELIMPHKARLAPAANAKGRTAK